MEAVAEPPAVVNTTSAIVPAACDGVNTVTEVALTLVIDEPARPAKVTPVVPVKFVPVIVTVAEPVAGPVDGETAVIVGAAAYV